MSWTWTVNGVFWNLDTRRSYGAAAGPPDGQRIGDRRRHVRRHVAAERLDLPHERAGDVGVRGIRQQQHGLDVGEVAVDEGHGRLVRHVELRADALDEDGRADLPAVVDEEARAPGVDADRVGEAGVADHALDEGDALPERQHGRLAGVVHDQHHELVVEARGPADHVEVPERDGVERSGDDGDPLHPASLRRVLP